LLPALKNFSTSSIIEVETHETEREVWTVYIYLSSGGSVTLVSLNILSPKGEISNAQPFTLSDLMDPKLWIMVGVALVGIWFTSKKTSELNAQRQQREQETVGSKNKTKKSIDELSKRLDDMNSKFSNFG
jgi:hypothetical protein